MARKLGEIKRMWVAPDARGLGIAQRLLDALEHMPREMGLARCSWTPTAH